jgi:hypothetical protein
MVVVMDERWRTSRRTSDDESDFHLANLLPTGGTQVLRG